MHGHGNKVLEHFEQMCYKGVELIDLTFLCHLSACCYATLVDEGPAYHGPILSGIYVISQELEHYDCIDKPPGLAGCPMR